MASPLFSAFGPEPIATRINIGEGRVLVTTPELYRRKVEPVRDRMPTLSDVILVGDGEVDGPGLHRWSLLMNAASPDYRIAPTDPEDMALLHFTSGTTGRPKGAIHARRCGGASCDGTPTRSTCTTTTYTGVPPIRAG
ncbi:AMP-binding protein [Mesorhizobium atlanticum]